MIHVYNADFEYQGEVDAFESLMWVRRWSKAGDFQIVLNAHTFGIEKLVEGHIITIGPDKTGIIAHIEEDTSESGKANDQILVRGLDLKGLIGKRITVPPVGLSHDALNANVETIMKRYVDANAISTNPERIIPNLSIAPDRFRGPSFYYQTRFQSLTDELEKLSLASNLGWVVLFTGKGYVFDTPSGNDLSILQSVNSPVIFGVEFDNVGEQKIVTSNLDYRNVAIVAGQGEGIEREIIVIGDAAGLNRNEVFIDARDIEDGANLPDRGRQKLSEYTKVDSFETEILTDGPFEYKKDWDLGDIVTIQNAKKTRTVHERIMEVTEIHEKGRGFQLRVVFGNALPTLIEKIKRELDEPEFNDGRDGEPGPIGETGPRGPQGLPGAKGDTGERGLQGLKGDTGLQGARGDIGPMGPKGDTGLQGVKGTTGATGPKGDAGYTPVKGIDYFDGATGPKGDIGARGPQGLKGDTGATGAKGETGTAGIQGERGPQGLQGPKGDVGPRGLQGIHGVKGDIGPVGPKGDQGIIGPPGSSQSYVLFEKNFVSSVGQTDFCWTDGWSFPVGIKAVSLFVNGKRQPREAFTEEVNGKGVSVQPGLDAGQYVLIVAQMAVVDLQGPRGAQGPQGIQGLRGDTGPQGPVGLTGAKGDTGSTGPSGPQGLQGPKGNTGPKGDKGDQGVQGVKGDTGATGLTGSIGRKGDAFKYADFTPLQLEGLRGPQGVQGVKGDTGSQGLKGDQGIQGPKGNPFIYADFTPTQLAGLKGEKGDTGTTGATGDTGARGLQGIQGIQGVKGDVGPIGLTGPKGDKGDTGAQGPPGAAIADSVEWAKVLNKPTSFPPSTHTHPISNITGLQSQLDGKELKQYLGQYVKLASDLPLTYPKQRITHTFGRGTDGWPFSYCGVITYSMHTNESMIQYVIDYQNAKTPTGKIKMRLATYANNSWGDWFEPETTAGAQEKLEHYKPFHIGATPPANKNLVWYDTN